MDEQEEERLPVVPQGEKKLRACLVTGLVKTEEQSRPLGGSHGLAGWSSEYQHYLLYQTFRFAIKVSVKPLRDQPPSATTLTTAIAEKPEKEKRVDFETGGEPQFWRPLGTPQSEGGTMLGIR